VNKLLLSLFLLLGLIGLANFAFASATEGTIDSVYKYAWGENIGWINFGTAGGSVRITDAGLSGYAWSSNYGWINLNPTASGVKNNNEGTLSGYAWGENLGWINFSGVIINSNGEFSGLAIGGDISGRINFNCGQCKVKTSWRPRSAMPACNNAIDDDGDGRIDYPADPGCSSLSDTDETDPVIGGRMLTQRVIPPTEKPRRPIIERIPEIIRPLIPEFLRPKPREEIKAPEVPIEELVPKEVALVFQGKWQLLPSEPIREFVLAPLPKSIRNLAQKFPTLEKTFEETGIGKITDVIRLRFVRLTLPGLTERVGLPTIKIEPGRFALPQGVPIANLSLSDKEQMPTEIVFARTGGELIDFNSVLFVTEKGELQQKISTISGKPLQLVVRPGQPVESVKGYLVLSQKRAPISLELPLNSLLASVIFANPVFANPQEQPVRVEERLVLLEFEYTDTDGDNIYIAEIQTPLVKGEFEIITVMDYEDPELGVKEIRLTTLVDPEGYIYEKDRGREIRIPGAIVSIYWLNPETKQYELWPAQKYQQENPQITDITGQYSFLVPEGFYHLKVEAPGYLIYEGRPFQVKEGRGVHINIELKTKYWWIRVIDWKTISLIAVVLLLLFNFYRDKKRERLLI